MAYSVSALKFYLKFLLTGDGKDRILPSSVEFNEIPIPETWKSVGHHFYSNGLQVILMNVFSSQREVMLRNRAQSHIVCLNLFGSENTRGSQCFGKTVERIWNDR